MAGYVAPRPGEEETARLLTRLRPLVAARAGANPSPAGAADAGVRHWLRLAWSQTRFLEAPFWWAGGLVIGLGILVTLVARGGTGPALFVLVSPVLAAAGVAYAFRPAARSLWEIEKASPVRPLELLYARLGIVLAFNLVLSLLLLAVVAAQEPRAVLWRLVFAWLGPMLVLAGSALYSSVRWGAIAGAGVPAILWAGLLTLGSRSVGQGGGGLLPAPTLDWLLPVISQSNSVAGLSLMLAVLGLALMRQGGRLVLGEGSSWN